MRFKTGFAAPSQSGWLSYGSLLTTQRRQSATRHRLVSRPSYGGQRVETALQLAKSIRQNLWKSSQGSGHAKAKHQCTQSGLGFFNTLSCAHKPNWSFNRDVAAPHRRPLTLALGPHL